MLGHREVGESQAVSKENKDETRGLEEGLRFRPKEGTERCRQRESMKPEEMHERLQQASTVRMLATLQILCLMPGDD